MKVSYEERLAIDFGLRRRRDEGNDAVLSVRAGGNAGQLFCSETFTSVDRSCDNNRLLNDGTHTYTYDFEGNRTKKTVTATGEATEYEWDHRNRLVRVTHLDSVGDPVQTLDYIYDVLDRRIGKTDTPAVGPGYTERYVYDGEHLALKFGSTALANRYLHGPVIDQILADEQVSSLSSPGDVLWPLADNLGTVRDLAEHDSGTGDTVIVNHISYDAYGGSRAETNAAVDHLFGYTGREWDAEADLQYNRARWYDPAVGRWLSEDPIGFAAGDENLARYVGNMPTQVTDPSGLQETPAGTQTSGELERVQELARLSQLAYRPGVGRIDMASGMRALVTRGETGQITIAFAGTDPFFYQRTARIGDIEIPFITPSRDLRAGVGAVVPGFTPQQYQDALNVVREALTDIPEDEWQRRVTLTGHSLGGGQATAVALALNIPAIVFNPLGTRPSTLAGLGLELERREMVARAERLVTTYQTRGDLLYMQNALPPQLFPDSVGTRYMLGERPLYFVWEHVQRHRIETVIEELEELIRRARPLRN